MTRVFPDEPTDCIGPDPAELKASLDSIWQVCVECGMPTHVITAEDADEPDDPNIGEEAAFMFGWLRERHAEIAVLKAENAEYKRWFDGDGVESKETYYAQAKGDIARANARVDRAKKAQELVEKAWHKDATERQETISHLREELNKIDKALGCYGTPVDALYCIAELQESVKRQEFLIASYAPAAEQLNDAFVDGQQLVGTLRGSLETVLTWLTNANAMPTHEMVSSVFKGLAAAGMSHDDLDKAAICILRGAAPQKQLDDDGVRDMLAHACTGSNEPGQPGSRYATAARRAGQ